MVTLVSGSLLAISSIYRIGKGSAIHDSIFFILLVILTGYLLLAFPAHSILLAVTVAFGIVSVVVARTHRERLLKLVAGLGLILILYLAGFIEYVLGLLLYTVPVFFGAELPNLSTDRYSVSILFHGQIHSYLGPSLWILHAAGAFLMAIILSRDGSRLAWSHFLVMSCCLVTGLVLTVGNADYRGPMFLYLDTFLWPFYALYGMAMLLILLAAAVSLFTKIFHHSPFWFVATSASKNKIVVMLVPTIFLTIIAVTATSGSNSYPYPPASTAITKFLEKEISIRPGKKFKGSVVSLYNKSGIDDNKGVDWAHQAGLHDVQMRTMGNGHRLVGLWYYDIPTLQELNHFITPPMFFASSRILSRTQDGQMRSNSPPVTLIDPGFLQSLGVRYIISPYDLGDSYSLSERVSWSSPNDGRLTDFLYELPQPNYGQYSPTDWILIDNVAEGLLLLKEDFDYAQQVVVTERLPDRLSPSKGVSVTLLRGGMTVTGQSSGWSLALLPLQFSHCLSIHNTVSERSPTIVRANLLHTAILFDRELNAELTMAAGPFGKKDCSLMDYAEMKNLGLGSLEARL